MPTTTPPPTPTMHDATAKNPCPYGHAAESVPPIPFDDPHALVLPLQVAAHFGTTVGTLAYERSVGLGPRYIKQRRKVLYRVADLIEYIEARVTDPTHRDTRKVG